MNHKHKTKTVPPASAGATTTPVKSAKISAAPTDCLSTRRIRVKNSPPRSKKGGADKAKAKTKTAKSSVVTAPTTAMSSVPKGLRQPVVDALADHNNHVETYDCDSLERHDTHTGEDFDYTTRCVTAEDFELADSYEYCGDPPDKVKCMVGAYRFDGCGHLRLVPIKGETWASLTDGCLIAGVPAHAVTGVFVDDGLAHVRGRPNFLNPDGVRDLAAHGIDDLGVHAEALLPHFRAARGSKGEALAARLEEVIARFRSGDQGGQIVAHTRCTADWQVSRVKRPGRLTTLRAYDRGWGEFLVVVLGTRFWIAVDSVGRCMMTDSQILIDLAGRRACLRVDNSDLAVADDEGGSTIFIAFEVAERLMGINPLDNPLPITLKFTLNRAFSVEDQLVSGHTVWASNLHRMLGDHLDFKACIRDFPWKSDQSLSRLDCLYGDPGENFEMAITEASEIAKQVGGIAGELVYTMLSNGGYFHGGPLNESGDETLIRLRDLMPDHHGRLNTRCVHEFSNDSRTFDNWLLDTSRGSVDPSFSSDRISLSEADMRGGIWLNFWERRFFRENVRDLDQTIG